MKKLKENKMWITVVVIGLIVIAILLAMLHQQKQNSPEGQASSYSSSAKTSSAVESSQDEANAKAYTKKAAHMKGHVIDLGYPNVYFTTWTKSDFLKWSSNYLALSETDRHKGGLSESFGTSYTIENTTMSFPLDSWAKDIQNNGIPDGYYLTVKDFNSNSKNSNVNPEDIKH